MLDRKEHWEKVYATKELNEVSWYQPVPETSLHFLKEAKLSKNAKIVDVGGGDSFLVDHLLNEGFTDLTVVDISENALERAKKRLGEKASEVKWIAADASVLELDEPVDFWHDRAAFHFLTQEQDVENYLRGLNNSVKKGGIAVIGTFSENGPTKCSGIEIKQYTEQSMTELLSQSFQKITCVETIHQTPFDTTQQFVFCSFQKI
ncbi:ubiquinone/menaquinone biosynthesis methyltransferase [compost metagenome]